MAIYLRTSVTKAAQFVLSVGDWSNSFRISGYHGFEVVLVGV